MEYIKANIQDAEAIYQLVQNTIRTVYPNYYPISIVDFFCKYHSKENIINDIKNGFVNILMNEQILVGTGSCVNNHITRVFVQPKFQGSGFGSYIMQCMEDTIALEYDTAILDASLAASRMYERRGYKTIRHEQIEVEDGSVLVYEIMEKHLTRRNRCGNRK